MIFNTVWPLPTLAEQTALLVAETVRSERDRIVQECHSNLTIERCMDRELAIGRTFYHDSEGVPCYIQVPVSLVEIRSELIYVPFPSDFAREVRRRVLRQLAAKIDEVAPL